MNFSIKLLLLLFNFLQNINTFFLRIGRQIAWISILLMVIVIIIQVFFRYVLNNALPWPDEVARFLMLWMTGLIAPSAYRWGGFVSIDMLQRFLPKILSNILVFLILIISLTVLLIGFEMGLKHINAGWIFSSSSIKLPYSLLGGKTEAMKLAWMYMSLPIGILLLILVNIELTLKTILSTFSSQINFPLDKDKERIEA